MEQCYHAMSSRKGKESSSASLNEIKELIKLTVSKTQFNGKYICFG